MLMPTRDILYLLLYTRINGPNIRNPLHGHLGLAYSLAQLSVWDEWPFQRVSLGVKTVRLLPPDYPLGMVETPRNAAGNIQTLASHQLSSELNTTETNRISECFV